MVFGECVAMGAGELPVSKVIQASRASRDAATDARACAAITFHVALQGRRGFSRLVHSGYAEHGGIRTRDVSPVNRAS